MKFTIQIETTGYAGYAIIEAVDTSFGYEPVSASAQPVPPIITFHADAHDIRSAELALVQRRAA